jgi:Predicted phosphatases
VTVSPDRRFDLVILDFDGVLADSGPWMLRNLTGFLQARGLPAPGPDELDAMRGLSNREIVRRMRIPAWRLPGIARDMRALMQAHAHEIGLFPGAADFLGRLQAAGVRTAIVSSNSETVVRQVLGGSAAQVGRYACGAALFGKAPVFRKVIRAEGVRPGRVLAVGDETRDIEAARRARVACAAVAWGYATPEALARFAPDHLADDFAGLLAVIGA